MALARSSQWGRPPFQEVRGTGLERIQIVGKTFAEKVIARAAGRDGVSPGEFVWVKPDIIWLNEGNFVREVDNLARQGLDIDRETARIVYETIDHDLPGSSAASIERKRRTREAAQKYGIHVYDMGRHGISHQLGAETGDIVPGMLVMATDVHLTTLGGIGALAIPISRGLPFLLAAGETWLRVPHTVKVGISGTPAAWMTSRDVAQWLIAQIGDVRADYNVLEFGGPLVEAMDIDGRLTLCNVAVEIGCKTAVVPFDNVTDDYFRTRFGSSHAARLKAITSDSEAQFFDRLTFDIGGVEPVVAVPPSPDTVRPLSEILGTKIDQAYIGSCAGGRMEDLRIAASVLRGRKVADGVRLLVVPSSQRIYAEAAREGLLETFAEAGAIVLVPNCSPCYGMQAALGPGDVCVCTATRNDPGRMGSPEARIFLAGPAIVAASAIDGKIAHPKEFLSSEVR